MKLLGFVVSLLLVEAAVGAPPKVDYLYPAGARRGTTVTVQVGGTFDSWPAQGWASHPGIIVTPNKASGNCSIAVAQDVPCGTHWLRWHSRDGASGLRPFLVNQVPEVLESEPNDNVKKPQILSATTVVVNGRLEKLNDVDVFALTLKKGQTLVAAVDAQRALGSPMDGVLQILSADGFVLAQNDDYNGMDPLLAFSVPRDGVYLVRLFCFSATPDSRIGFFGKENCVYRLTLTTGPCADFAWPLAVDRGQPGEVEMVGWNVPPSGKKVAVLPGKNQDSVYMQPPGFARGAIVSIEDHPVAAGEGAGVLLLTLPVTVSGLLAWPGQRAHFSFQAKKGQKIALQIEARSRQFPLDTLLAIQNTAGKTLQTSKAAGLNTDPTLDFNPPADDKYTLELRDLHDEGGPRHRFLLRATPAKPMFQATLASDRFTGSPDKPPEIIVSFNRRHSFTEPVEFHAEGLPPDVRLEQIPGKDTGKATLRVTGLKEPCSIPFLLWAFPKGQEAAKHPVTATLPELGSTAPFLWLSVGNATKAGNR